MLTRKRRAANSLPSPAPGVTKAAVAEVESSDAVKVVWNWYGEMTRFYVDLCFRKTKEAKMKTEQE
jgi:hypothetical protein